VAAHEVGADLDIAGEHRHAGGDVLEELVGQRPLVGQAAALEEAQADAGSGQRLDDAVGVYWPAYFEPIADPRPTSPVGQRARRRRATSVSDEAEADTRNQRHGIDGLFQAALAQQRSDVHDDRLPRSWAGT
jgi:hypothetical protein